MSRQLIVKLNLVLAMTAFSFFFQPTPSQATPICAMACTNPFYGSNCSAINCSCDALGGAVVKCTDCADNDYRCPGNCYTDPFYGIICE